MHCSLNSQAGRALWVTQLNILKFRLFKMIKVNHQNVKKISNSFAFHTFKSSCYYEIIIWNNIYIVI